MKQQKGRLGARGKTSATPGTHPIGGASMSAPRPGNAGHRSAWVRAVTCLFDGAALRELRGLTSPWELEPPCSGGCSSSESKQITCAFPGLELCTQLQDGWFSTPGGQEMPQRQSSFYYFSSLQVQRCTLPGTQDSPASD